MNIAMFLVEIVANCVLAVEDGILNIMNELEFRDK